MQIHTHIPRTTRTSTGNSSIADLIAQEEQRQRQTINLIASENYASTAVRAAMSSRLTNKYAEGYPHKRYYAGCAVIDDIEQRAIEGAKKLFNADHANVQPHAGSQANMAVFQAALKPGDTILGMSLAEGGHLTHGHAVNFSGKIYTSISYGVDPHTHCIDYEKLAALAQQHRPKLIIAGASAYPRILDFERFAAIAQSVGALFLADIAHIAGLVATGVHPSPIAHADFISSTTHKTLRGPRGGLILARTSWAEAIDRAIMPGTQGGPFLHAIAAKAIAFEEAQQDDFKQYQQAIVQNAQALASALQALGYTLVSGGTDNHMMIVDLRSQGITGHDAQQALEQAGIIVSKSCIPQDPQKPWVTSGIRLGTPAVTSRAMAEKEMVIIAHWIDEALKKRNDLAALHALAGHIATWAERFYLP